MSAMIDPAIAQQLAQMHLAAMAQGQVPPALAPGPAQTEAPLGGPPDAVAPPLEPVAAPPGQPAVAVPLRQGSATQEQLAEAAGRADQGRETMLRAQQEAEDQGFSMPAVKTELDASKMPEGTPTNLEGVVTAGKNLSDESIRDAANTASEGRKNAHEQAKIESMMAADSVPLENKLQGDMVRQQQHLEAVQNEVEPQTQRAIANYTTVDDEMRKMAMQQPKDFYDQAGVNSVFGRIAMFLGGAGTNGQHSNHNLEQMNSMAEKNVAAQRQRFEMLQHSGNSTHTLYGMLQSRLQDTVATETAIKNASLEVYKSGLQQVANQYATPMAMQKADVEIAKINDTQRKNVEAAHQSYLNTAANALALQGKQAAIQTKQYGTLLKAQQGHMDNRISGFVGWVPKAEHPRLSKLVGGAQVLVKQANEVRRLVQEGKTVDQIREYLVNDAVMFKGARDFLETGTRIEAGEQSVINQLKGDNKEGLLAMFSGMDAFGMADKMESIAAAVTRTANLEVHAAAPTTTAFDSQDGVWGAYDPRTYKYSAAQRLAGGGAHTDAGQSMLQQAPNADPSEGLD